MSAATRVGALLTAAQTGHVLVGPYVTSGMVDDLVSAGFGYPMTSADGRVIGFRINDRGRDAAERARAGLREFDAPIGPPDPAIYDVDTDEITATALTTLTNVRALIADLGHADAVQAIDRYAADLIEEFTR